MDVIHGFTFLLGAAAAWFITRQSAKERKVSEDEWLIRDVSAPTDADIEHILERLRADMRLRNLNEFSSDTLLDKDAAGSQYLRHMRIKMLRDTLRSNGWTQTSDSAHLCGR